MSSIPRSGRSPGGGNGYPLQYFCLENSMDGGAWQAAVHGVAFYYTRPGPLHEFLEAVSKDQALAPFQGKICQQERKKSTGFSP